VTAFNESGDAVKFKAKDLFARVIQHEVDHLDGVLFIDRAKKVITDNAPKI
jgi:peptide deformylase